MAAQSRRKPRPPLDKSALDELALRYVGRFATTRAKLISYLGRKLRERGWAGSREADVAAVADRLAELDADGASEYRSNADAFSDRLDALKQRISETPADNAAFVATEPVAVYLLEDAGLHDDTPAEFTAAVENGTDVPPLVLRRVREELQDGHVQLLAFNAQTSSGQTEQLRDDARAAGAAVVEFTETLPEGTSYLEWMDQNVTAVTEALTSLRPTTSGTAAG